MRSRLLPPLLLAVAVLCAGAAFATSLDPARGGKVPSPPRTPVLSARRIPSLTAGAAADPQLRALLDAVVAAGPSQTCVAVAVNGREVYRHQPTLPVPPASNQKLVTATVALEVLGGDHRFRTTVRGRGPAGGTVQGDLFLVGGGDPVLSTRAWRAHFADQPPVATSLEALADRVAAAGVRHVTGRVLGDESRYDSRRSVPTWPDRYLVQHQTGFLSALTVNDGFTSFPDHETEENKLDVEASDDPAGYAASTFAALLRARGVQIDGSPGVGVAPAGLASVAHVDSPPLHDIVRHLLTESDNEAAELLVKELGKVGAGQGSTTAGVGVLQRTLRKLALPTQGLTVLDGSGLDHDDRLTCGFLAALLHRAGSTSPVAAGLAVAGESGTLRDRFTEAATKGRIKAKTGTLDDVTALSGFATTPQGSQLTFAYVATGVAVGPELLAIQDQLGQGLVSYAHDLKLAALGPATG